MYADILYIIAGNHDQHDDQPRESKDMSNVSEHLRPTLPSTGSATCQGYSEVAFFKRPHVKNTQKDAKFYSKRKNV